MVNLLALDVSSDDVQQKNRASVVLSAKRFQRRRWELRAGCQRSTADAPLHFVKCIKENKYAKFEAVLGMYKELSNIAANEQEVELSLTAEGKTKSEEVKVDCTEFQDKQSIQEHDKKDVVVRMTLWATSHQSTRDILCSTAFSGTSLPTRPRRWPSRSALP